MHQQEFSIEIPDKEADQIHSGMFGIDPWQIHAVRSRLTCFVRTVEKAVEYIMAQPDGMLPLKAWLYDFTVLTG